MNPIFLSVLKILGSMATSLLTERFIKQLVIIALEKLSKKTQSDADDRLLEVAKKEWGL